MKANRAALAATAAITLAATAACSDSGEPSADGEIDVWIAFTDYRLDWAKDVAKSFSDAHDGYTVKVQGYDDYEPLFDSVSNASAQGNTPEIVHYFEAATQDARDAVDQDGEKLFKSLEEAIDGREEILDEPVVLDDVVGAVQNYYTTGGEFSSMPWNTSTTLFYGNESRMEAAGVDAMPETWAEIEAACEKIMASDDAPKHCITQPNHGWFFEQSLAQQGELLADNDNGRSGRAGEVDLTSDGAVDYLTWLQDMVDKGYLYYSGVQNDWDGPVNAFGAQEAAFLLTSSGDATAVVDTGAEAGYGVDVARMPYNDAKEYGGNLIGGGTLWLANGLSEKNEDGALAFMQYLNNAENAASWHRTTGYIPITGESEQLLEDEGWFDENPYHRTANDQLALADGSPASAGALMGSFVSIREEVTQAVEAVLTTDVDPAERLQEAQEKSQKLLDDYNTLYTE
ncbi:extracellular solute-binding protein [Salininema proteolyticum]|uniref:Extracellular solute-binding protein n=1 Tax=Salininema proteolyticum TaxID=1607685 RepID=A0ABV8U5I2_9ACTN